jgi:hypothetical protein
VLLLKLLSPLSGLVDINLGALLLLKRSMVLIEDQEEGADILQQAGSYFYYLKDLLVIEQVFYHLEKCVSEDSQRTVKHGGKHKTPEIENLCASELSFLRIEG